ncbi:28922_t:CDS:2, partial [Dentiscutata erythropus]
EYDRNEWHFLFNNPLISTSLTEFWSIRWHQAFREIFVSFAYKPLRRLTINKIRPLFGKDYQKIGIIIEKLIPIMGVFFISGIMHEYIVLAVMYQFWKPGEQLLFFMLQAIENNCSDDDNETNVDDGVSTSEIDIAKVVENNSIDNDESNESEKHNIRSDTRKFVVFLINVEETQDNSNIGPNRSMNRLSITRSLVNLNIQSDKLSIDTNVIDKQSTKRHQTRSTRSNSQVKIVVPTNTSNIDTVDQSISDNRMRRQPSNVFSYERLLIRNQAKAATMKKHDDAGTNNINKICETSQAEDERIERAIADLNNNINRMHITSQANETARP